MVFGLVIGFTGPFEHVTTKSYSTIANSRTLKLTIARNLSSQFVFNNDCSVTNPKQRPLLLTSLPAGDCACQIRNKTQLLYDWRFTANQFVLVPSPLGLTSNDFFFNWTLAIIALMKYPLWWDVFVSYECVWPFVKCTCRTYSMLLKILPFALSQSRLCKADQAYVKDLML
jgi:hypothetical protein